MCVTHTHTHTVCVHEPCAGPGLYALDLYQNILPTCTKRCNYLCKQRHECAHEVGAKALHVSLVQWST